MAVSPRGAYSARHAGLSWKAGVSFVTFQPCIEDDLARLALGSRMAHQPRGTFGSRHPFEAVPAWQAPVTFGPWLSWETNLPWGPLWPGGPSESFHVADEAAVTFLAFLSSFARQSGLPWGPGRTLVAWRSWLTLHDAIGVAWPPRGARGTGEAGGPILSTESRH